MVWRDVSGVLLLSLSRCLDGAFVGVGRLSSTWAGAEAEKRLDQSRRSMALPKVSVRGNSLPENRKKQWCTGRIEAQENDANGHVLGH